MFSCYHERDTTELDSYITGNTIVITDVFLAPFTIYIRYITVNRKAFSGLFCFSSKIEMEFQV